MPVSLEGVSPRARKGPEERVALCDDLGQHVSRAIGFEDDASPLLNAETALTRVLVADKSRTRSSSFGQSAALSSIRDFRAGPLLDVKVGALDKSTVTVSADDGVHETNILHAGAPDSARGAAPCRRS